MQFLKFNPQRTFRSMLPLLGAIALWLTIALNHGSVSAQVKPIATTPFQVPPLTYAYDALAPYIDAETMHLHHDKHHQTAVDNLNAAIEKLLILLL